MEMGSRCAMDSGRNEVGFGLMGAGASAWRLRGTRVRAHLATTIKHRTPAPLILHKVQAARPRRYQNDLNLIPKRLCTWVPTQIKLLWI